jgi:alpha-ketoglutaric semialdehyde dehydrogenase
MGSDFSPAITGSNWIAGQPSRMGSDFFHSLDPRTRAPFEVAFCEATSAEVDQAAGAAAAGFQSLRQSSAEFRADLLEGIAATIEELGEVLITTADRETALGPSRLSAELQRTTGQLRLFRQVLREGSYIQKVIDPALPERQPSPRPGLRRMLIPLGPVAVFEAANFPFAFGVAGGDTASALAAGCPVIVKSHPGHPATGELFAQAINHAIARHAFHPGCFSFLLGKSNAVGQELVNHPLIQAIGFTGSQQGGRAIYNAAAARPHPIPVYAEMGSLNPVIILPGALAERAAVLAEQLAASATLGVGQFCTKPGLVFLVDSPMAQAFVKQTQSLLEQKGAGILLNEKVEQQLAMSVAKTLATGQVTCLAGGNPIEAKGFTYPNTLLTTTSVQFRATPALQTEHFGPVILFVYCDSLADLADSLNHLEGTLTASLQAQDHELSSVTKLLPILEQKAGRLVWNGFPTGVEVTAAMQHGGPYPATTAPWTTSVGTKAIDRFLRPVVYQNFPPQLLPMVLRDNESKG